MIRLYTNIFIVLFVFILSSCGRRETNNTYVTEPRPPRVVKKTCAWSYYDGCYGCEILYSNGTEVFSCED